MDYKYLIKKLEEERLKLFKEYKKSIFFRKIKKQYLNKYDELLIRFYTLYENKITNKR